MNKEKTPTDFWETPKGFKIALSMTIAIVGMILFWNISKIGIWEPWEANDIVIAEEYATRGEAPPKEKVGDKSWNWSVPTKDKTSVSRSLLKTMLLSQTIGYLEVSGQNLGTIEFRSRAPIAFLIFLITLLGFFTLRGNIGNLGAMVASVAFATMPAIYIGSHNLGSDMMLIAFSTGSLLLFYMGSQSGGTKKWIWGIAFGLFLALAFLDQRLFGLYLPLFVITVAGLVERMLEPKGKLGKLDWAALALGALGLIAIVLWNFNTVPDKENATFLPHILQWSALMSPIVVMVVATFLARSTWVGKTLFSIPFLVSFTLPVAAIVLVSSAYGDANPVLLKEGVIFGKIPLLTFLLENQIFDKSVIRSHVSFDIWIRQIGFSMLPWAGLAPLGFAFLGKNDMGSKSPFRRFALVWILVTFVWTAFASGYNHYFFSAYFPIAFGIGGAFSSESFWKELKKDPLTKLGIGVFAIAIVMMLGKDIERFPTRFIEAYVAMTDNVDLAKEFSFGKIQKVLKYLWMVTLGLFFFGWISFSFLSLGAFKSPKKFLKELFSDDNSLADHLKKKEDFLASGQLGKFASFFEKPRTFVLVLVALFSLSAFIILTVFIPKLTLNLSQRGVFETYTKLAQQDEAIFKYQVSGKENSVYLGDIETIRGSSKFLKRYEEKERMFAVIPRSKLAAVNRDIRRKNKTNIPVLDARSSRLVLVSNQLKEGEKDENFIADLIVEGEPKPEYSLAKDIDGKKTFPVFDGQIEMLGYDLDRPAGKDGLVSYAWGEQAVFTYYFRVLKRMPSNQKIFLHVDHPGVRINGDHVPNEGIFPTNYWMKGDVVKSVHSLEIESYSTPGKYSVHFGFFLGSKRAKVSPKGLQDGHNRVDLGYIRVRSSF